MEKKEIIEHGHKTNEFIYTVDNVSQKELMEVIQYVFNQYIRYQKPSFDIYSGEDRKQCIDYLKYCITLKENNDNEVLHGNLEHLSNGLFDYYINQDFEDEREYKHQLSKVTRRQWKESKRVQREYFR